jgi:hypothetical protein
MVRRSTCVLIHLEVANSTGYRVGEEEEQEEEGALTCSAKISSLRRCRAQCALPRESS